MAVCMPQADRFHERSTSFLHGAREGAWLSACRRLIDFMSVLPHACVVQERGRGRSRAAG